MDDKRLEQLLSKHNLINDCYENAAKVCNSLDWSGRSDETLAKYDAVEECVVEICKLKLDNS